MYELLFLSDSLSEKIDQELLGRVRNAVLNFGGEVKKESTREKQKLAYPIKKRLAGFYAIFEFQMPGEKIDELQKQLKLENDILRFLIIDINKAKSVTAKPRAPKPVRHVETKPEAKGEKIKIEELDKKLEEILKE
jgi:small subunit ribosomal protein S6